MALKSSHGALLAHKNLLDIVVSADRNKTEASTTAFLGGNMEH